MNVEAHTNDGCAVCLLHDVLYGECVFVVRDGELRHLNPADVFVRVKDKK